MATKEKPRKKEEVGGFTGWVEKSYTNGMNFSQRLSMAAVNMPFMFFEAMGIPEEKTAGLKGLNEKFIGGVYKGTDVVARKAGSAVVAPIRFVGSLVGKLNGPKAESEPAKAPKPKAKKAEGKKVKPKAGTKKAPAKKKAPPKVAAVKAEPETKKAA